MPNTGALTFLSFCQLWRFRRLNLCKSKYSKKGTGAIIPVPLFLCAVLILVFNPCGFEDEINLSLCAVRETAVGLISL